MLKRILNLLERLRVKYTWERMGAALPVPSLNPNVIRDLRPEQVKALIALISSDPRIRSPLCGGMIEMTMATGKTHILGSLCRAFRAYKVVISSHKQSVVRSLHQRLSAMLEPDGIEVGIVQGNRQDPKQVTVCTNAMLDTFDPDDVGVVMLDECHSGASEVMSGKLLEFKRSLKFGFSGTIKKRNDGKSKYLESVLGPILYEYSDVEAESDGRVSPVKIFAMSIPTGPILNTKKQHTLEKLGITENHDRNHMIKRIADLVPEDQQLIIFVRTIQHIEELVNKFLPPGYTVYHGQLSSKERRELEQKIVDGSVKRIISNDALSEGVDTTSLDVMIDAAWTTSDVFVSQKGGRNRRQREGKNFGVIITFLDEWGEVAKKRTTKNWPATGKNPNSSAVDVFCRRARTRIKQYKDRGWPVVEIYDPAQIEFDRQ